jgi:hypothetical protein
MRFEFSLDALARQKRQKGRQNMTFDRRWLIILTLGLWAIVAGCPQRPLTRQGQATRTPEFHTWDLLTRMNAEQNGYAMYTYVLFGRRLDIPGGIQAATRQRYESLLDAIVGSTLKQSEARNLPREETNDFYIPSFAAGEKPSLANYDVSLSLRYLAAIGILLSSENPRLAERLTTEPGPFLVSTLKPIGQIRTEKAPLLYADLSSTNDAAMPEIIAAYKTRLAQTTVSGMERFAPLRLALLNLILDTDQNLRLVKVAVAQWQP